MYVLDDLLKGIRPGEPPQAFDWGENAGHEAIDRSNWRPEIPCGPTSMRASAASRAVADPR